MTTATERRQLLADVPIDTWLKRHWKGESGNLGEGGGAGAVSGAERWISVAGGVALAVISVRQKPVVGAVLGLTGAGLALRGLTGRCPIKARLGAENPGKQAAQDHGWGGTAAFIHRAVTVNRPRQEVYETWRDFSNLAHFMENIERIEVLDEKTSRWSVKAPLGRTVQWDALVTEDAPGERIAWETAPGADIKSFGVVEFRDGPTGRGTEVRARFAYKPPAGTIGRLAAKVFQREPYLQARRDLRRFKAWMETGEIPVGAVPAHPATPQDLRI
jgi:uncharacterized membrane protein